MADAIDLTQYSDADLEALRVQVANERDRRALLAQAVPQGIALAQQYAAAGGDVEEALAQIAAAVTAAADGTGETTSDAEAPATS